MDIESGDSGPQSSGAPPAAPVATEATNATDSQFDANWNASTGATGYRLDVSIAPDFSSFVVENQDVGNVLTFTVTGMTADTVLYYRVRATNGSGTSDNSNVITFQTDPTVAPGDPSITITITQAQQYIFGPGATDGGQSLQVRSATIGTHLLPDPQFTDGSTIFHGFAMAFPDTMTLFNDSGSFGGTGGFSLLYESDDAPSVWQDATLLNGAAGFWTVFSDASNDVITVRYPGIVTALSPHNLPAP